MMTQDVNVEPVRPNSNLTSSVRELVAHSSQRLIYANNLDGV